MTGDRRVRFQGEGATVTLPSHPEIASGLPTCCGTA